MRRFFGGDQFQIVGRSKSLLDGLARLESEAVDLILLSNEFGEEELSLFTYDAYRRGFTGLILRVAYLPGITSGLSSFARHKIALGPSSMELAEPRASIEHSPEPGQWASPRMVDGRPISPLLSERQRTVALRVSEGWSNQEIAHELNCSESSVKATLQQLFHKYGVRKRTQIVRCTLQRMSSMGPAVRSYTVRTSAASEPIGKADFSPADAPEAVPITVGDFVMDLMRHRVWVRGTEAQLTPLEWRLLTFLVRHPQELMSHHDLLEALWGNQKASRESLRVLIQSIRRKIETSTRPRYILTQSHFGYRFVPS